MRFGGRHLRSLVTRLFYRSQSVYGGIEIGRAGTFLSGFAVRFVPLFRAGNQPVFASAGRQYIAHGHIARRGLFLGNSQRCTAFGQWEIGALGVGWMRDHVSLMPADIYHGTCTKLINT